MDYITLIITTLFSVVGWLLASKDRKQQEEIAKLEAYCKQEIDILYRLHHEDEEKLAEYKLIVAQSHYTQPQIDWRFQQLDNTMKELSHDIKELTKVMTEHFMKGTK